MIEVTPYRTEGTYSDARRPDQVQFGATLHEDLQRRDFTVNALAYRITTQELVDEFDGIAGLQAKRLQTVGDPDERLSEDALRMMRAVRLAAELGFMIEHTMEAIARHCAEINRISIERVASEFLRIVGSPTPMQGIVFLEKLGLLEQFLPEILPSIGCEQGGIHAFDVYEHLLRSLQAAADKDFSLKMRLAALFHDIGKPKTRRTGGKTKYTFFGHEVVGARMTKEIFERLKLPKDPPRTLFARTVAHVLL